jgi:cytoskeletal protein RodZ
MVENFGLHLKHERELRGVSLEEIAETTKIHIRYLEALESNEFDKMPGEVFIKGYIRSYARMIGFDSDEMVNVYDESVGRDRKVELENRDNLNEKGESKKKSRAGLAVMGLALIALVAFGYSYLEGIAEKNKDLQARSLPKEDSPVKDDASKASSVTGPSETTEINFAENQTEEPSEENLQSESSEPASLTVETEKNKKENLQSESSEPASLTVETEKNKKENLQSENSEPAPLAVATEKPKKEKQLTPVSEQASLPVQTDWAEEKATRLSVSPAPTETAPDKTEDVSSQPELMNEQNEPAAETSAPEAVATDTPKTPIEPAVMEKDPIVEEKPVIIQQVMENSVSDAFSGESPPEAEAKPLHLKIQVQGNSWFNVTVDESKEEDFILPGGSSKNVYGREKIQLTIGNRNGTELFLNEQPIDLPPGSSDVIRNFDITANLLE